MGGNVAVPVIQDERIGETGRVRRRRFLDMSDVRIFSTSLTAPASSCCCSSLCSRC